VTARAQRVAPDVARLPACLAGPRSTQLLVELAHDLRSPLTSMLVLAESLLSGVSGRLSAGQEQQLRLLYAAALRLCETTSDTLELARETGAPADEVTEFVVARVIDDVRRTVLPMAEEKGLRVECEVDIAEVRAGSVRALQRTLLNLTTNALKAAEQGVVRISARARRGALVEFAVTDDGPGMTLETLRTLWEPFRPVARGRHSIFSSSGLGLAICRKLVTQMGGAIRVRTELGRGSRFAFTVPLTRVRRRRPTSRATHTLSPGHHTPAG
jgi:signal transduction histidine kinase